MDESENKTTYKTIYPFKNILAFDAFFEGMQSSFAGQTQKSIELFEKSLQLEPDNPFPYNFLVMSLEFITDRGEEERKVLCEKWVKVAIESGNKTQILRAQSSLDYYKLTPEERKLKWEKT
jgi:hypothetical protein